MSRGSRVLMETLLYKNSSYNDVLFPSLVSAVVADEHKTTFYYENNLLNIFFIGPTPDPLLNWVTEPMNVSANQRWVLLTSLKAATSYQFRVSAVNTVGEGPASDPTDVLTLPQEGM